MEPTGQTSVKENWVIFKLFLLSDEWFKRNQYHCAFLKYEADRPQIWYSGVCYVKWLSNLLLLSQISQISQASIATVLLHAHTSTLFWSNLITTEGYYKRESCHNKVFSCAKYTKKSNVFVDVVVNLLFDRRLLAAGCHRVSDAEREVAVQGDSLGSELQRELRRHLPFPGYK